MKGLWRRGLLGMSGRRLVPLLIFLLALAVLGLRYLHQMDRLVHDVTAAETQRLRDRLGIEQNRLDLRLGAGDTMLVRRIVSALGLHDGLDQAYLIDPQGRVLGSLARVDIGRPLEEVLRRSADPQRIQDLFSGPHRTGIDVGVVPQTPLLAGWVPLIEGHRLGVLVDMSVPMAEQRQQAQWELALEAVAAMGVAALLALLLHLLWFRRAQRLVTALERMGGGDLSVRAGLGGADELALIGRAADRMAGQLQADRAVALHMSELVNRSPLVVIEWRREPGWPVHYVNENIRQWGYEPRALVEGHVPFASLLHPEDAGWVGREVDRFLEEGPDEYHQEYRILRADGSTAWVHDHTRHERDASGQVVRISGILLDVSDRKRAQLAQREQAELLRMFYELPFLGMAISSPADKRWLQVNDRLCEILGYSREELLRMTWVEMTPPGDLERNVALFDELVAGRRSGYQMAKRFVRKDGRLVHTEIDVRALRDEHGGVRHLFATIQDVTERLRGEAELEEAQRERDRLVSVLEATSDIVSMADPQGRVFYFNRAGYELLGLAPDTPLADIIAQVHPEWAARKVKEEGIPVAIAQGRWLGETAVFDATGREVPMSQLIISHHGPDGALMYLSTILRDISERKAAEAALRSERARLDEAQAVARIGSWSVDVLEGRVSWSNHHYKVLGLDPACVTPSVEAYLAVVHPDDRARVKAHVERTGSHRGPDVMMIEHRIVTPQGVRYMEERASVEWDAEGRLQRIFGTTMDVTERVLAAQAVTDLKDMLEQAETVSLLGSWAGDAQTQRLNVSNQLFRNLGLQPASRPPSDEQYLDRIHPDDRARVVDDMQTIRAGGTPEDFVFRTNPVHGPMRWMRRTARRIDRSAEGLLPRYIGTLLDITDSVQAEEKLRQANQALEQRVAERTAQLSQANQELEAFSYTVSHDLKAPLRGIDGYSQLLVEEYGEKLDDDGRQFVRRIRQGVQQMGELISDLLEYSRMERRDMAAAAVAIRPLVESILEAYDADIRRQNAQVRMAMDDFTLALDREGISVVMRNLIGNALKFSRDSQPPVVEIGTRVEHGRRVVWVRDNGVGFDMKYHDRMFGIFQRLHRAEEFPGTGVGLALVAKAVQRMGGRVWADSSPGNGATFYLEFPQ